MQAAGTLELIAELAVAFAGFTGLVGAFRGRHSDSVFFRAELRLLIEYSLVLMANALLPLFLWHAGLSEEAAWRVASLLSALISILYYVARYRTLAVSTPDDFRTGFWIVVTLDSAVALALLANAAGALPWEPQVVYLVALAHTMLGTASSFLRFTSPLWREPVEAASR